MWVRTRISKFTIIKVGFETKICKKVDIFIGKNVTYAVFFVLCEKKLD